MTTISRVYDPGLGRTREPYPHELPPLLRGPARSVAAGRRRAERDDRERARRAARGQR